MVKMESDRDTVMEEQVDWTVFQMIKTVPGISAHLVLPSMDLLTWPQDMQNLMAALLSRIEEPAGISYLARARYRVIRNEDHVCQ